MTVSARYDFESVKIKNNMVITEMIYKTYHVGMYLINKKILFFELITTINIDRNSTHQELNLNARYVNWPN